MAISRVSIRDVAREAQVSITTVSRVINDTDYPVSAEVRRRVQETVEKLGYVPSMSARQLRRFHTDVVGLIVRDIANPYFGEIAKGVTERAIDYGFLTFVCSTGREPAVELRYYELLSQHRVKGIIMAGGGLVGKEHAKVFREQIARRATNGVRIIGLAPQAEPVPLVSVDFEQMVQTMVSYLVSLGHRQIGLITGREDVATCRLHVQGFMRALESHNIPNNPTCMTYRDFTEDGGYAGCIDLMETNPEVTAICAGSDTIATGVLQAARHRNVRVPNDLSVIGIGDLPPARFSNPALTTMRVPRYEMAASAVDMVCSSDVPQEDRRFSPQLIERGSVADIR
jgi:LacI family transcriptional regulator